MSSLRRSRLRATTAALMVVACPLEHATADSRADGLITGTSIGRVRLGATKAAIRQSNPQDRVVDVEIPLENEGRSSAVQLQRGDQLLVTAEVSEAGRAWRITTEHPMFKTAQGVGVGATFEAVVQAHGTPESFEFPEGHLFARYRLPDGTVAFELDRGFDDVLFKKVSPPATARVLRVVVIQP